MAWNEPGGGKDPWGGGRGDGPPDLDEALKKFREKFGRFGGGGNGNSPVSFGGGKKLVPVVLVVIALIWAFAGVYQVDEQERGVVLRLGKYVETVNPGLHWNPPLIDDVTVINVTGERQYQNSAQDLMLTEDENIVDLQLSVQYNIVDPESFVLNVREPETSLRHATDSALRHVVGSSKLDAVISTGREQVGIEVKERLQNYLDNYETGINVVKVNVQDAKPPNQVKAAYDDVIKAREDQERSISEAQSYANGIIPEARGIAQRMLEEAQAYEARVVASAEGEAQRFTALLTEYENAPEVTRKRLYLDTLQDVMGNSTKVLVDVEDGNNIFYLPLDKSIEQAGNSTSPATAAPRLNASQIGVIADEIVNRLNSSQSTTSQRRTLR